MDWGVLSKRLRVSLSNLIEIIYWLMQDHIEDDVNVLYAGVDFILSKK